MSAELVAKLQLEYAKGLVVTIVGSGISVAATENQLVDEEAVATWSGLLRHGVRRCEELCLASPKEAQALRSHIVRAIALPGRLATLNGPVA